MVATILDGRATAADQLDRARESVAELVDSTGIRPCLVTVIVGDDPASHTYVQMKTTRARSIGMDSRRVDLAAGSSTDRVVGVIEQLSADASVHGILVQHPMSAHIDERAVFDAIAPDKDVDGVTSASFAAMALGHSGFASCTPGGIVRLLDAYDIDIAGRHAVIVGRSPILGLPMGMLLLRRNATVTYCHSYTTDLADPIRGADIVVAAVGRPGLVRAEWIKPGAVVIDAGYNAGNVGDVDPEARSVAGFFTPVPGGIGPMTIATLLTQTVDAAGRATSG